MGTKRYYDKFKFRVEIDGFVIAAFNKVGPLKETGETVVYRDGASKQPDKSLGNLDAENIVCEQGATDNEEMANWWKDAKDDIGGPSEQNYYKNISVVQTDRKGTEIERWNVFSCFPVAFEYGNWDATAGTEKVMRIMELAVEGPIEKG